MRPCTANLVARLASSLPQTACPAQLAAALPCRCAGGDVSTSYTQDGLGTAARSQLPPAACHGAVILRQQGGIRSMLLQHLGSASSAPAATAFSSQPCSSSTRSFATQPPPPPQRDWDWDWLLGNKPSRRPAIKKPQRHQWHFCDPSYDPSAPVPKHITVPFAPPPAAKTDDWDMFRRMRPPASAGADVGRKFKRAFVRHLKQRDVDWRDSFTLGVAEHAKGLRRKQDVADEAARQASWQEFKERLFQQAAAGGGPVAGALAADAAAAGAAGRAREGALRKGP